mgnify:CR=1 FL=1|nr:MAG TPA: Protein of unknown function (DUF551) [Caudoviricetes sp.]
MNEWISVNERLPEEGTLCVVLELGRSVTFIYLANFKQGLFRCTEEYDDYADYEISKATHWIPVPSFPECDHEHLKEVRGMEELRTVELDVQKGVFNVNGIDLSNVSGFSLTFDKGLFQLEVTERFSADGTKMRPEN